MTTKYSPKEWLNELGAALAASRCKIQGKESSIEEGLAEVQKVFAETRENKSAIWWAGNGGSSALTSHLSQDVLNKLNIRSMVLNDAALITCMANDFGYENVYSRPLSTLAQSGDLLIAVSSSGQSKNILACTELAQSLKMPLITLSAFKPDNPLWRTPAAVSFYIPSELYGIVEVGHEALLHAAIETQWLQETRR